MKDETLLLRQIHPSWVQSGRVTSQAFRPTPKDQKQLSVYDGDQISAENAWNHYTVELRRESTGVLGVTVAECRAQKLQVVPDPEPFPEHVLVDFGAFSGNQVEAKAKYLRQSAVARDWQYRSATFCADGRQS